jgi:hypothetical protein
MPSTISGLTLNPFVSSSKNLRSPALDAGRGAFFFLLIVYSIQLSWWRIKYITGLYNHGGRLVIFSSDYEKLNQVHNRSISFTFCNNPSQTLMVSAFRVSNSGLSSSLILVSSAEIFSISRRLTFRKLNCSEPSL